MPGESNVTPPGSSSRLFPVNPGDPIVQQALAFNKLTQVPANWRMDGNGRLVMVDSDGTAGPLVPVDQSTAQSFLSQLAHATPYIAAAFLMGVGGSLFGGTPGATAGAQGITQEGLMASNAGAPAAAADVGAGAAVPAAGAAGGPLAAAPTVASSVAAPVAGGASFGAAGAEAPGLAASAAGSSLSGVPGAASGLIPGVSNQSLFTTGASLFGNLFGAYLQSSGAQNAANITAGEAKYAADLTAQANAKALAFQEAAAENAFKNTEVSRETNYNWQASKAGLYNTLGNAMNFPSMNVPSFIPGVDPNFTGTASPSGSTGSSSTPGANYQPLIAALNGGKAPQDVIDQFNTSQGLKTGSSYAWRSIPGAPGGGVVEIPGGAYLAPGSNGVWGYTGAPSGGSGTTQPGMFSTYQPPAYYGQTPIAPIPGALAGY